MFSHISQRMRYLRQFIWKTRSLSDPRKKSTWIAESWLVVFVFNELKSFSFKTRLPRIGASRFQLPTSAGVLLVSALKAWWGYPSLVKDLN